MEHSVTHVLFDYGETLVHEHGFDPKAGTRAVLDLAGIPYDDDLIDEVQELAERYSREQRIYSRDDEPGNYLEIPNPMFQAFLFDSFGLRVSLSPHDMQKAFWDAAAPATALPYAAELLHDLAHNGYHLGVISNISFTSDALAERLAEIFPDVDFDLVLSSADYGLRKPNPLIFEYALHRLKINPDQALFVGDTHEADIIGAQRAEMPYVFLNQQATQALLKSPTVKTLLGLATY